MRWRVKADWVALLALALAGCAEALLAPDLPRRAAHFAARLGLRAASAPVCQLSQHRLSESGAVPAATR